MSPNVCGYAPNPIKKWPTKELRFPVLFACSTLVEKKSMMIESSRYAWPDRGMTEPSPIVYDIGGAHILSVLTLVLRIAIHYTHTIIPLIH